MKNQWFKTWGWIYKPATWQGWILTIWMFLFWIQTFNMVQINSHSISDTLYGIYPFWIPAFLIWLWLASKSS